MTTARRVALDVLGRVDDGAYANLALGPALERLPDRERPLATELVYGTTRMRRACDWLVDRFLVREVEPVVRRVLRLGAYQLQFLDVPDHAAVSETVGLAPGRARGLVNAVLRRVAGAGPVPDSGWPSLAVRLSQPDWIVERALADLGEADGLAALARQNEPPRVHRRGDGYVQDLASQWVATSVGAAAGEVVADLCAAPGGKATALAASGAHVVAADVQPHRAELVQGNARLTGHRLAGVLVADATRPPLRPQSFDRVLVDVPCSGLGVLRRRPDARWRIAADDVGALAGLQRRIVEQAVALARPGGLVAYSACTFTAAETLDIDRWAGERWPALEAVGDEPAGEGWRRHGRGWLVLPHDADTDAMYLLRLEVPVRPRA